MNGSPIRHVLVFYKENEIYSIYIEREETWEGDDWCMRWRRLQEQKIPKKNPSSKRDHHPNRFTSQKK